MAWLARNGFWVLIAIAFIAMHVFGHGGHGAGDRQPSRDEREEAAHGHAGETGSSEHQH